MGHAWYNCLLVNCSVQSPLLYLLYISNLYETSGGDEVEPLKDVCDKYTDGD